jgi:hypothetical protein
MLDSEAFLWMDMSIAEDSCISKRGNSEEIMMQRVELLEGVVAMSTEVLAEDHPD